MGRWSVGTRLKQTLAHKAWPCADAQQPLPWSALGKQGEMGEKGNQPASGPRPDSSRAGPRGSDSSWIEVRPALAPTAQGGPGTEHGRARGLRAPTTVGGGVSADVGPPGADRSRAALFGTVAVTPALVICRSPPSHETCSSRPRTKEAVLVHVRLGIPTPKWARASSTRCKRERGRAFTSATGRSWGPRHR
jgi:hypothetical protein